MLINWFTVFAQIVNFFILVFLLKRFLYGPIVKAMHKREERIAGNMKEAKEAREEARKKSEELDEKLKDLEERKEQIMTEAKGEVKEWKEEALQKARQEVEDARSSWQKGLSAEKQKKQDQLRHRLIKQILSVSQKVLSDLADESLQNKMHDHFFQHLENRLKEEEGETSFTGEEILVETGGNLTRQQREEIQKRVKKQFKNGKDLTINENRDLGLGIRVMAGSTKWEWTIRQYLDELEKNVFADIAEQKEENA